MLLPCPWCGPRNAAEFKFAGEARPTARPGDDDARGVAALPVLPRQHAGLGDRELVPRRRLPPVLVVERHTLTHEVRGVRDAGAARGGSPMSILPTTRRRGADEPPTGVPAPRGRGHRPPAHRRVHLERHPLPGHPGDTIVSALAAAGERVFSRSYKYHRPRGLLTASYLDPGSMVQVGDEPNVRGAHRLLTPGLDVSSQNTWPSLRFDVKAVNGLAGRFLATGFYYKTFIKPERLWPAYEKVLRTFVHAGEVPPDTDRGHYDKRHAHPDVVVAGGGPAGMAAAVAAARAGAPVMLVEEEHQLGGHLRWGGPDDRAALRDLRAQVAAQRASRCSPTRWSPPATTTTGSRSCSAACPASTSA